MSVLSRKAGTHRPLRVAGLGECMIELSLPGAGPFAGGANLGYGGDAYNVLVYLRRLLGDAAAHRVAFVTALGDDDAFSAAMRRGWVAEGLDVSLVQVLPGRLPGLYAIETHDDGERRFHYWREQAAVRALFDDGVPPGLVDELATFDLFYVSGISLALFTGERLDTLMELLHRLREAGVTVAFDSNHRPGLWPDAAAARVAYERVAPWVDVALPTFEDEAGLFGDDTPRATSARWRSGGCGEVIVKRGAKGCLVVAEEGAQYVPAVDVPEVVDTTAAGDSFNGAYLAERLTGAGSVDAARRAAQVAATVVQNRGAIVPRTAMLP